MNKARTKDESFMLALYNEADKHNNKKQAFNCYAIGRLVGLQERGVNAICTLLAQANFIKKEAKTEVALTSHGIAFVEDHLL